MTTRKLAALLFGLAAAVSCGAVQADVVFSDSDFNTSDYTSSAYTSGSVTPTVTQVATGNPGNTLQTSFRASGSYSLQVGVIRNSFTYNPATSGAIESIDVSIDRIGTRAPAPTFTTYFFRPLILQDGFYYQALSAAFVAVDGQGQNIWATLVMDDLTAADFVRYDFSTGLTSAFQPNFGAAMTFGFVSLTSNGTDQSGETRNDNWIVRINTVPEPGSLALLGLGLAGLAAARRRRH